MYSQGMKFESGNDVGGDWHWNRCPGARVDSEFFTCGFDFAEESLREWRWSELIAAQPEVSRYLRFVVERLGLRKYIRTGTRIAAAAWKEDGKRWDVTTDCGETVSASCLISATGVQVIQTIAPEVQQLTVFQRTPTYCVPQRNRRLSDTEWRDIQRDLPAILVTCRNSYSSFMHEFVQQPYLTVSPTEREAKIESLWQQPGFA